MPSPIPQETSPRREHRSRFRHQAKGPVLLKTPAKATNNNPKPQAHSACDWQPKSIFNLTGREQLFVSAFVGLRDVEKTAEKIGISAAEAQGIYDQTHIYLLCAYECNRADALLAHSVAKARQLTVEFVDATVARDLREMKPSMAKVKLIELAYHRLRVPIGPVERAPAPPQPTTNVYAEVNRLIAERRAREEQERAACNPIASSPASTPTPSPSTAEASKHDEEYDDQSELPLLAELGDFVIENY